LALVLGALIGWETAQPAGAAVAPSTFEGSCQLTGTTTFSGSTATFVGTGICTGTYLGLESSAQPAKVVVQESGLFTPALGPLPRLPVLASGTGNLYLWNGVDSYDSCPFLTFSVTQAATAFTVSGSLGGLGVGVVLPSGTSTSAVLTTVGTLSSTFESC
jgi:hypothetical protein